MRYSSLFGFFILSSLLLVSIDARKGPAEYWETTVSKQQPLPYVIRVRAVSPETIKPLKGHKEGLDQKMSSLDFSEKVFDFDPVKKDSNPVYYYQSTNEKAGNSMDFSGKNSDFDPVKKDSNPVYVYQSTNGKTDNSNVEKRSLDFSNKIFNFDPVKKDSNPVYVYQSTNEKTDVEKSSLDFSSKIFDFDPVKKDSNPVYYYQSTNDGEGNSAI